MWGGQRQGRNRVRDRDQTTQDSAQGPGYRNRTRYRYRTRHRTVYRHRHRAGEKPEHLQGTGQSTVSRQSVPEQELDNPERKTGTGTGAGQKKQLSASGITVVYKCVTQYLYLSNNYIPKDLFCTPGAFLYLSRYG